MILSRGRFLILAALTLHLQGVASVLPQVWAGAWNLGFNLQTRYGTRGQSMLTAGLGTWYHIYDCIKNCRTQEGGNVDQLECANSVITSVFSVGLAALTYHQGVGWTKRSTFNADAILSLIPDSVKITDMKIMGDPIIANSSSPSLRRRDLHSTEEPINVYYNGSLPFTFILHHQTVGSRSKAVTTIPLFIATDGTQASIHHIQQIASNSTIIPRNGINGYNHIGLGGAKVLANSDPIAYWDDVGNWLRTGYPSNRESPLNVIRNLATRYAAIGHSSLYKINGYLNGQFMFIGEPSGFNNNWETGWNWCFGVYKTNCP